MKNRPAALAATIFALSMVQMGANGIAPILAPLAEAFPKAGAAGVQFLMTFPSLAAIPASLAAGRLVRRVPRRTLAALGCALVAAGGLLAAAFHARLGLLFAFAALLGAGIGLAVPMAISLVSDGFDAAHRPAVMGLQSCGVNLGAMLMTFAGGLLAQRHWSCNYLVYLLALPGLVLSLLYMPGGTAEEQAQPAPASGRTAARRRLLPCAAAFSATLLFNLLPANLSMYLTEQGFGGSAESGAAATLLLLAGAAAGACYGRLARRLGSRTAALGYAALAAGLGICLAARGLPAVYAGCLAGGATLSLVMPQATLHAAVGTPADAAMGSAVLMACCNLGGFLTPVLTDAARVLTGSSSVRGRLALGAVLAAVCAVCALFAARTRQPEQKGVCNP